MATRRRFIEVVNRFIHRMCGKIAGCKKRDIHSEKMRSAEVPVEAFLCGS